MLVGLECADDAGIYKISPDLALVQTVDLFTPIVGDPYTYGLIAAANSLSDIYAMGGTPITALNVSCFSIEIEMEMLAEILRGAADKLAEAGAALLGGHTITDKEVKYGMAVTGIIHPDKIITNGGAKPGDKLVLTKYLGTGITSNAYKNALIGDEAFAQTVESMTTLNKYASEAMIAVGVNACTDITGFGLAGHLNEMLSASEVSCILSFSKLPLLDGLLELVGGDQATGGAYVNQIYFEKHVVFEDEISEDEKMAIFDPQTSGGLLISVDSQKAEKLMEELKNRNVNAAIIGEIVPSINNEHKVKMRR